MNKFLEEILSQPKSFEDTLKFYRSSAGEKKLNEIAELFNREKISHVIFTGMGSSYFTSYAAACLFNSLGIYSISINTSELIYYHASLRDSKTLIICISQSGESFEVVKLLEELPKNNFCLGISNDDESSLMKKVNWSLLSKAGKEEMTSTKTYTAINLTIYILGLYLVDKWNSENIALLENLVNDTTNLLLGHEELTSDISQFLGKLEFIQFIGRGPLFASAQQSELMFKEAAKMPAAGTFGGEFRHGPMEMIKLGFKAILFAAEGKTYLQSIKMAKDIVKFGGKVLIITNKDPMLKDKNIKIIEINQPNEYLFTIQSIIPIQLLVNHLALAEGIEPGNFVHGGKITLSE